MTGIGDEAFELCSSLTSLTILDSVIYIGYSVFSGCGSLMNFTIPNSVTHIENSAFCGAASAFDWAARAGTLAHCSSLAN